MKVFLTDPLRGHNITYEELINNLNCIDLMKYICFKDPKDVFLHLAKSIAFGMEAVLLDGDWSASELERQGIDLGELGETHSIEAGIHSIDDLYNKIEENKEKWGVSMFTSGTTGKPKKVRHNYGSASRAVRQDVKHKDDRWLFCYNPTHFAGLQVFLQAFLNRNTIVVCNDPGKVEVDKLIRKQQVTHISATPSYFRFVLPTLCGNYTSVRNITSGGEKLDEQLKSLLSQKFPYAKLTNVYASTEAGSLFASDGECFRIEDRLAGIIKVEDNELYIHRSVMGEFDFDCNDQWYPTGDIVEYTDGRIRFLQRESDSINVGGYKVNPVEVEEEILKMDNIVDVLVYGINSNLSGKALAADVVLSAREENISKRIFLYLSSRLQKWKIPRIIHVKDSIGKTNTGKKVRNR